MDIDYDALIRVFLAESEEGLAAMEERLIALEDHPDDAESLGEIFRVVHTLKGDSGSLGFKGMSGFAHRLEEVLEELRGRRIFATSVLVTLLLRAVDAFRAMLPEMADGVDESKPAHEELLVELEGEAQRQLAEGSGTATTTTERTGAAESRGEGILQSRSLRVGLDKLDELLNLTGEVTIAREQLTQTLESPNATMEEVLEVHREADRLFTELRDQIMSLRMVPIGPTFRHYSRTVRDLAKAQGKEARLVIGGEDLEIDNSVLQALRDPLTHMLRNALDHGIEPVAERERLGKPAQGTISLSASRDAGTIVIELADDGRGLNRDRILARARRLGLIGEGHHLSDHEAFQLVFEPGVSTSETVTQQSGRGVGMDVVRRGISAIRGTVSIDSREGEGTRISIRLPLTAAIIEGLLVGVGEQTFVVPLDAVLESVDMPRQEARESRGIVSLRSATLPFVRLRSVLGVPGEPPARENLIVIQTETGRAGLVVDVLHGQSQTVIKPLGELFQGIAGISDAAVLGSGRVALILDVPALLRGEVERGTRSAGRHPGAAEKGGNQNAPAGVG